MLELFDAIWCHRWEPCPERAANIQALLRSGGALSQQAAYTPARKSYKDLPRPESASDDSDVEWERFDRFVMEEAYSGPCGAVAAAIAVARQEPEGPHRSCYLLNWPRNWQIQESGGVDLFWQLTELGMSVREVVTYEIKTSWWTRSSQYGYFHGSVGALLLLGRSGDLGVDLLSRLLVAGLDLQEQITVEGPTRRHAPVVVTLGALAAEQAARMGAWELAASLLRHGASLLDELPPSDGFALPVGCWAEMPYEGAGSILDRAALRSKVAACQLMRGIRASRVAAIGEEAAKETWLGRAKAGDSDVNRAPDEIMVSIFDFLTEFGLERDFARLSCRQPFVEDTKSPFYRSSILRDREMHRRRHVAFRAAAREVARDFLKHIRYWHSISWLVHSLKEKTGNDVAELILLYVGCPVRTRVAMVVGSETHENCTAAPAHCALLDGMARRPLPPLPAAKRVRIAY
jgi:hypothetical protein